MLILSPSSMVLINHRHLPATPIMMTVITPWKSPTDTLDLVSLSDQQPKVSYHDFPKLTDNVGT